jgi:hypothetical protein
VPDVLERAASAQIGGMTLYQEGCRR